MWASSIVSRSNLRSMLSILQFPSNFFANCSTTRSEIATHTYVKEELTELSLPDLLLCQGEDINQLGHYLRNYLHHQRAQRNICVNFESFEEVSNAFKEFKESVIARADALGHEVTEYWGCYLG
jgi:glutathione peroxidase-family protein